MYKNLEQALLDLEKAGMLKRIHREVDPYLEMAEIARQTFENHGPALLFEHVKGSPFRAACNIFGTQERLDFLFRDTLKGTQTSVLFKSDPVRFLKNASPAKLLSAAITGLHSLPRKSGSIEDFEECRLFDLPQIVCWPDDGGAFITLPQVATRPGENSSVMATNVGMYRVQISGNDYASNECGLHYQIKRDIARHHQKALEEGRPLKVSIFMGGPPAHSVAAMMPMPEDLSELLFAGMLGGRGFHYFTYNGYLVSSDADFCILGELQPGLKPEGPFGDHIGYYSDRHDFPYLKVEKVLCKKSAIYPFTVVGRPPQEDTLFGNFVHQITKPMVPASVPGLVALHAVDEAGVHPLCLALAHERFLPYLEPDEREPLELLKTANAILGFNQASLTKYLLIAAVEDFSDGGDNISPTEKIRDVAVFFAHVLERVDFSRDLHFETCTSSDTLDYTGTRLNHGSKLTIAAAGPVRRNLRHNPQDLESIDALNIPGVTAAATPMPGVIVLQGPAYDESYRNALFEKITQALARWPYRESYPWITLVDSDPDIGTACLRDFLWLTFTRSDPAQDVFGFNAQSNNKHWGCDAPVIIDARIKPHHQKALDISESTRCRARQILTDEQVFPEAR